jgi:hypothetical protein
MATIEHSWYDHRDPKGGKGVSTPLHRQRNGVAWCRRCGTIRLKWYSGFWTTHRHVTYTTPVIHPNGDRNNTVFENEPPCMEVSE